MRISLVSLLVSISLNFVLVGCVSATEIQDDIPVPVPTDDYSTSPVPTHDWPVPELKSMVELSSNDLARISTTLGVNLQSGDNTFYEVDDSEVQVNKLTPENSSDLLVLFHNMFSMVGNGNSIILGSDCVYEIITDNPYAAEAMRRYLDLSELQTYKITPHSAYGEFAVTGDAIPGVQSISEISQRLGFEITELINQTIVVDGVNVQVNFILPVPGSNPLDARDKLVEWKGTDVGVYGLNNLIIEIMTDDLLLAEKIWHVINIPPPPRSNIYRFNVSFKAIPIADADPMKVNDMFNMLVAGTSPRELKNYDPTLEYGNSFPLFLSEGRTVLNSNPEITLDKQDASISIGSIVILEQVVTMPVEVEFELVVETNRAYERGPEDILQYITATDIWPVNNELARSNLEEARLLAESDTVISQVMAVNSWVRQNIEYGGTEIGSRYGVETTCEQGYGRCWDLSDVFVTLSRTAGLPTRQVAGWVYGLGGHVWAQVWLDEQNAWVDVDPTRDHVGVTSLYIPIWGTIDGEMLFLYSSMPQIERMGF